MGVGHFVPPPSPEGTLKTLGGIGLTGNNGAITQFNSV